MRLTDSAFKPLYTNRWFIWGMPLSGKTSLGKKLKKLVSFPVYDLDKELEHKWSKTIHELFEQEGEASFRQKEADALRELVTNNPEFIIVVGGGTPCHLENDTYMLRQGNCLFMNTSLDEIKKRTEHSGDRPLLQGNAQEHIQTLYKKRLPIYQTAHAEFFSEKEGTSFFER